MVYKCCITGYRENYDAECKVKIFLIPNKKYSEEWQRWLEAIPQDNIPDTRNTFICNDHLPKGYETKCVYGKLKPLNPTSVFTSRVKPSLVPTQPASPRCTKWAHSSTQNTQAEEIEVFIQNDRIASYKELTVKLKDITEHFLVAIQLQDENFVINQSVDFIEVTGIPKFMLKINNNLTFVSFHCRKKCSVKTLPSNGMAVINSV